MIEAMNILFRSQPCAAGSPPTDETFRSTGRMPGGLVAGLVILLTSVAAWAANLSDWPNRQELPIPAPGLVKLSLPVATLDAALPGLDDLRILDPAGNEVAFTLEHPRAGGKVLRAAKSFRVTLNPASTVLTIETGLTLPLEAVTLDTPAGSFIKAVAVEGSTDQQNWQPLASGQPIFRRNGVTQLQLPLSAAVWPFLRLTVNDQRSEPIPFTGVTVQSADPESVASEPLPVAISERIENPGQTRLTINLGAANLAVASLQFATPDPLFTRNVMLAVKQVSENAIREQTIAGGAIYRVEIDGQPASARLSLPVDQLIPARELVVLIQNDDSPPLQITGVTAQRRPVLAVFMARQGGAYALLTGNPRAAAPRYDLSALGGNFKSVPVAPIQPGALAANAQFRAPEALPEITGAGAALDVTAWKFRKPVQLSRAGVQQVELDLDVLAHAQAGCTDLRFVRDGIQAPYILEHTSITRPLTPLVTLANDSKQPRQTRWSLKLPLRGLPVTRLVCQAATPLFKRELSVYEMIDDGRGRGYERHLGSASWVQVPDHKSKQFTLQLVDRLTTDTLFLVTDNGDNPPIELAGFQFYYPVSRVLFKSASTAPLHLYYGNPQVGAPSYDLSLVAPQLLSADKAPAALGAEEQLQKTTWAEGGTRGHGGVIFWPILAVVVAALLFLISRLLPKHAAGEQGNEGHS